VNLAELVGTEYPLVRLLLLAVAVVNVAFAVGGRGGSWAP
jgi:hypothetical protein